MTTGHLSSPTITYYVNSEWHENFEHHEVHRNRHPGAGAPAVGKRRYLPNGTYTEEDLKEIAGKILDMGNGCADEECPQYFIHPSDREHYDGGYVDLCGNCFP